MGNSVVQSYLSCAPDVPGLVAHREGDGQLVAGAHVVARPAEVGAPVDLDDSITQNIID